MPAANKIPDGVVHPDRLFYESVYVLLRICLQQPPPEAFALILTVAVLSEQGLSTLFVKCRPFVRFRMGECRPTWHFIVVCCLYKVVHIMEKKENRTKIIHLPADREVVEGLRAGDDVLLTGVVYAARDAAHKRMTEAVDAAEAEGKDPAEVMPFPIEGAAVYYMGPSPAPPGKVIGSAGPTTSGRMDKYTPKLLDMGLKVMIGKGKRSDAVNDAIVRNGCIYLAAVGGAGALLSKCIKESEVVAYDDLGAEAVRRLYVEDFPAIVVTDCRGECLYR